LFVMCMFFHGELAALKPAPRYLTTYFLMVSLGGALGGVVVGFIAPKFFNTYYEFGFGLVITLLLAAYLTIDLSSSARPMARVIPMVILAATGFTGFHVYHYIDTLSNDARLMTRNFYGTLRVKDTGPDTSETAMRRLMHGVIMHGEQYLYPAKSQRITTYYTQTSGAGLAVRYFQQSGPMRMGVVGLGAGTMAAYGRTGDVVRFYEINPQVIEVLVEQPMRFVVGRMPGFPAARFDRGGPRR